MRVGLDTNVLIYTHMPAMREHQTVRRFLLNQLIQNDLTLVVTPSVLHEFVRVVTDPRRFDPEVSMAEAMATASTYLNRPNILCVDANEAAVLRAFEMLSHYQLGRKRIADTLFAAILLQHETNAIITCNPKDFDLFDALRVIDPRS